MLWTMLATDKATAAKELQRNLIRSYREKGLVRNEAFLALGFPEYLTLAGNVDEAVTLHKQTTDACKRKFGVVDFDTARCMGRFARHYVLMGDTERADQLYAQAIPTLEELVIRSDDAPQLVAELAAALAFQSTSSADQLARALALGEQTLEMLPRWDQRISHAALARAYMRLQMDDKALAQLRKGVGNDSYGYSYDNMLMDNMLEELLTRRKDWVEMEAMYRARILYHEQFLHTDSIPTRIARKTFVDWLLQRDRADDAEAFALSCEHLATDGEAAVEVRKSAKAVLRKLYDALGRREESVRWATEE